MIADIIADNVNIWSHAAKAMVQRSEDGQNILTDLEICRYYRKQINSEMKALTVEIKRLESEK